MPNTFDKTAFPLHSCHVRVYHGLIFVCLAEVAPDFESYIGFLGSELELSAVADAKVIKRSVFTATANWKVVVENDLECYHCPTGHRTYAAAHKDIPVGKPPVASTDATHDRMGNTLADAPGSFTPIKYNWESPVFRGLTRSLIGVGVSTESVSGKPVAPPMGKRSYDGIQSFARANCLMWMIMNPDHAVIFSVRPRSVTETDMEVLWLVNGSANSGVDYDTDVVTTIFEITVKEDKILVDNVQKGINSSVYAPGLVVASEPFVAEFDRWYLHHLPGTNEAS
jgi:Rieske 2Fe-2S family protein